MCVYKADNNQKFTTMKKIITFTTLCLIGVASLSAITLDDFFTKCKSFKNAEYRNVPSHKFQSRYDGISSIEVVEVEDYSRKVRKQVNELIGQIKLDKEELILKSSEDDDKMRMYLENNGDNSLLYIIEYDNDECEIIKAKGSTDALLKFARHND